MKRSFLLSTVAIVLTGIVFADCPLRESGVAASASSALETQAQQRFLINYCYAQYRSQSDVSRCIARGT
jgi:hypothetical protein